MSNEARTAGRRPAVAGAALVVAAALIAGGCSGSSSSSSSTLTCPSKRGAAVIGNAPAATGRPAAGWTQPDADLASTRYVASAITSADVSKLGVAWTVPLTIPTTHTDGAYAATPVIVNGVVYVQDLESNVYAISLATGKVLWTHDYNSPNGGPDGVNVAGGVVYAATARAAVALDAATGAQLWSRTLIGNDHEGIAMAPGYNHGTVYVSTVPANVTGQYLPGGEGILWALNAKTGVPEWSWNQVQNLWGNPGVNSGGGLWYTPSFDAQGNIYLGIANPAPIFGTKRYPLGSSRPGPDLYTDSVVKLSPAGKLLWYYQLTPHDLYDWDLQNPPVLTTANGRQDRRQVRQVVHAAFRAQPVVADLVDVLRASAGWRPSLSLVALEHGAVVGHVLASRGWLDAQARLVEVLVLSPLSVTPGRHGQGKCRLRARARPNFSSPGGIFAAACKRD